MPKIYLFSQYKNVSDKDINKFAERGEIYPLAEDGHRKLLVIIYRKS